MFDLLVIMSRYVLVFYQAVFLWQGIVYILDERGLRPADRGYAIARQRVVIGLMHVTAFLILAYKPGENRFDEYTLIFGGAGLFFLMAANILTDVIYKNSCPLLWNGMFFLIDVGVIMLQRLSPASAQKQLIWFAAGFFVSLLIPFVLRVIPRFEKLEYLYLVVGGGAILLPFFFGVKIYGAENWIQLGGIQFQPSELVKFLFVFYVTSALRKKISFRHIIFPSLVCVFFVCVLVVQRDLGGALIFFMTYMVMLYIATGSEFLFLSGMAAASVAAAGAYRIFSHVRVRVSAWQNPWADIDTGGYQITQSLFAIGTWGLLGSGLTRGFPGYIPIVTSDFIFAAICEEMGAMFGIGMIGVYIMVFYRGLHVSLRCKRRYYSLIAAGFTAMLAFQTFVILGGVTKLIPLTGVTLPFVSYGGSSITVSILMVGILQWIFRYENEGRRTPDE